MKKLLFILLSLLPVFAVAQHTKPVTPQWSVDSAKTPHGPLIFTYTGKIGGPDSIYTKRYIDSVLASMSPLKPTNGIQLIAPDSIGLGGDLTQDAFLNLGQHEFFVGDTHSDSVFFALSNRDKYLRSRVQGGLSESNHYVYADSQLLETHSLTGRQGYIQIDTSVIELGSLNTVGNGYDLTLNSVTGSAIFTDNLRHKGIDYNGDYSGQATDNTLISRKTSIMLADSAISAHTTGNIYNTDGSLTADRTASLNNHSLTFFDSQSGQSVAVGISKSNISMAIQNSTTHNGGTVGISNSGSQIGYTGALGASNFITFYSGGILLADQVNNIGLVGNTKFNVVNGLQYLQKIAADSIAKTIADSAIAAHPGISYTASGGVVLAGSNFQLGSGSLAANIALNAGSNSFVINSSSSLFNTGSFFISSTTSGITNDNGSQNYGVITNSTGTVNTLGSYLGYTTVGGTKFTGLRVNQDSITMDDAAHNNGAYYRRHPNFTGATQILDAMGVDSLIIARTGVAGYEVAANKATSFSTLNNTLYPTTQAVANYALSKTGNLIELQSDSIARINLGLMRATTIDNQFALYLTGLGDSLTAGYGGTPWLTDLQTTLAPRGFVTINTGVGGQTSTQIAVRAGCVTTTATVVGGSIPASGGVTVTFPSGYEPVTSQGPSGGTYGSILGIPGLVTLSTGVYTFTRTTAGSITSVSSAPFVVVPPNLSGPVTIWVGRNNFTNPTQVIADIDSIVAHKSAINNKYVIYTILNATSEPVGTANYNAIIALNSTIMSRYPGHAFDLRTYLVVATGNDPTGIINTSYKFDDVHLNTAGYQLVANYTQSSAVWKALTGGSQGGSINVNNINQWFNYNPITGPSGISSFTGTTSLGLKLSGGNGPTNWQGIDFVNSTSANPLLPFARIAAIAGSSGSMLSIGTSNNYTQGVNNQSWNMNQNGDVSIGGTTFLGSKFTITPNTTSATNISRFLYGNPTALGATLGSYQYLDELQNNNSGSGIDRFQRAFYRRVAGTGFQGTEMRMQYAVDNSFTTGGLAYMGIGADASGNGTIFMGTNGTDMLNITSTGVNITGALAVTPSTFTAKNLTVGASGNANYTGYARPSDGALAAYAGYRHTSTSTAGDFVVESDGGAATLTLNAGTVDVLKVTSTGVTLPLFTTAGILHTQVTTGLLSTSLIASADLSSSLAFPGSPTTTTQSPSDNSTKIATTAFTADVGNTATDANYTITSSTQLVKLPVITAARTVTLPTASSYTGRLIRIWNQNSSGTFLWTFASTVKDRDNSTITAIANQTWVVLESDGTNWNWIH